MCWIEYDIKPEVLTAEEDIPCYKVTTRYRYDEFMSIYRYFSYRVGETYKLNEEIEVIGNNDDCAFNVFEGFHSYSNDVIPYLELDELRLFSYGKNLDWFPVELGRELFILDCVIPKGSKYLLNRSGEYVSDCLRVVSFDYFIKRLKNK